MVLKYAGSLARYPARALFLWYLSVIVIGGLVLWLPISRSATANRTTLVDSLFTSTSAVCVTGLTVRSTSSDFSGFGQAVILLLIQLGGIGIMTLTTFAALALRGQTDLRQRATLSETLGIKPAERLLRVLVRVIGTTLAFETVGAVLLFSRLLWDGYDFFPALWYGLFHSISAFCNAGFSLYDDSLERFQTDFWINGTIMGLIVTGGIGFPVLTDLGQNLPWWNKEEPYVETWRRCWDNWLPTTKLVLIGTAALVTAGTLIILILEWDYSFAHLPWYHKPMVAMFQSVTTRTAGFNTVPIDRLTSATLFIMMLWMFVGGGPCSTAGGAKVSTFGVLVLLGWHQMMGRSQVVIFRRAISREAVDRAITTVMLFALFATLGLAGILVAGESMLMGRVISEQHQYFLASAFEVISALCTVGLSVGITATLSDLSKIFLILLMFAGRLGPLSVILAVSRTQRDAKLQYAKQEILIG